MLFRLPNWMVVKKSHKGRISAELTPHSGQPKTTCSELNVNTVSVIIRENRYVLLQNLALQVNIPETSLRCILKDQLHMRQVSSTWVPHFLMKKQMEARISACEKRLKKIEEDPVILSRVTGSESGISHFEPLLKKESITWKSLSSPLKKK